MSEPLSRAVGVLGAMQRSRAAIRATYETIAESFAATRVRPWPEVLEFLDGLTQGSRVLDLGCGNGRHARIAAARGHRVVGLDFSRRLLSIGKLEAAVVPRVDRFEWIEGDATTLPLRDASFDGVICVAVLHHLPTEDDRHALLAEVRRVLLRGGRVFISVWSLEQPRFEQLVRPPGPGSSGDVEVPWLMPDGSAVPRFYHLFQEGELRRLIIESGLQGETFFQGSGNYFALAKNDG